MCLTRRVMWTTDLVFLPFQLSGPTAHPLSLRLSTFILCTQIKELWVPALMTSTGCIPLVCYHFGVPFFLCQVVAYLFWLELEAVSRFDVLSFQLTRPFGKVSCDWTAVPRGLIMK